MAADCQNHVTIAVHLFYIDGTSKNVMTGFGAVKEMDRDHSVGVARCLCSKRNSRDFERSGGASRRSKG